MPKNIFLPHFELVQNFNYFVRSAPVNFPSKIQFSINCLKCCRNVSFDEWNKKFCQKIIFLPHFEIVQNFHYFVRSSPVYFLSKVQFSKKCLKCCRNVFFWWVEQIILPKNIFLPHFEIVQNFHYFVRSAPIDFLSKIQFSKKCLKCCRNVSFDEWNKLFCQKNIFLPHFEIVQNFHYFVRSAPVDFLSKIQFSKKCLKCCRNASFDEWNK